jgi:hypothetical protein
VFSFSAVFWCHDVQSQVTKGVAVLFLGILHGVNESVCIGMDGIVVLHVPMGAGGYLTKHL